MRKSLPADLRLPQPAFGDRSGVQFAPGPGATSGPRRSHCHCLFTPSGVRPPELPPQRVTLRRLTPSYRSPLPTIAAASNPLPIPARLRARCTLVHSRVPFAFRATPCSGSFGQAFIFHCQPGISSCLGAATASKRAPSPASSVSASSVTRSSTAHCHPAPNLALAATSSVKCN